MASEIPDFGERFVFRPRSPTSRRGKKTAFADGHAAAQPGTRNGTCKTDFSDEWTPALNIKTKTTKTRRWTLKPNKMETPYFKKKMCSLENLANAGMTTNYMDLALYWAFMHIVSQLAFVEEMLTTKIPIYDQPNDLP